MGGEPIASSGAVPDRESKRWIEQLRAGHPRHDRALAELHGLLRRVALHELSRRRSQLGSITGPELEDLAQQATDDAVINLLSKLDDFRGLSRFTTWAYKFAVFAVSGHVARHAWRRQPPGRRELDSERLPESVVAGPAARLDQREQLSALSTAIRELTDRQREVFVAIALNDVSIDVVALQLGTNRNAVYKNLFDARRSLRARMVAAGHPVVETDAA